MFKFDGNVFYVYRTMLTFDFYLQYDKGDELCNLWIHSYYSRYVCSFIWLRPYVEIRIQLKKETLNQSACVC